MQRLFPAIAAVLMLAFATLAGTAPASAQGQPLRDPNGRPYTSLSLPDASVVGLGNPLPTGRPLAIATASFNRPANTTPYTAGAVVCTSTVPASCAPLVFNVAAAAGVTGQVIQYTVTTNSTNQTSSSYSPQFCLSLFTAPPTLTNGDGGAFQTTGAASYLGPANTMNAAIFSDGSWAVGGKTVGGTPLPFRTAGAALYGVLSFCSIVGTYTPASGEAITVTLAIEQ